MFTKQIYVSGILKYIIYLPAGVSIPHIYLENINDSFGI